MRHGEDDGFSSFNRLTFSVHFELFGVTVSRKRTSKTYKLVRGHAETFPKSVGVVFCRRSSQESFSNMTSLTKSIHSFSLVTASTVILTGMLFETW